MKTFSILLIAFYGYIPQAQESFTGTIFTKEGENPFPLEGANVYWLGTQIGTITDQDGTFSLPFSVVNKKLVISYIGFKADTLSIINTRTIRHLLSANTSGALDEVTITQRRKAIQKSYFETQNIINVNSDELLKAACCNLSESFETNPSIDVNFSDALTGTKQIKMLGLTSPYLLITEENIPMVRGASQAYGLTFTPGTWIESIQITKGVGSVVNGFESIAGQINTEIKKPFSDVPLFFNFFTSANGRQELNTHGNFKLNDKWSTGIFVHGNQRTHKMDQNNDSFLDVPLAKQVNILNRWQYTNAQKGWVSFISFRWMQDDKLIGAVGFSPTLDRNVTSLWGSEISTARFDSSLKIGYVFPESPYQSFGFQSAYSNHKQEAYYGFRQYDIDHESFYANLLFNSIIGNTKNKFKAGINFSYDQYIEAVDTFNFNRIDNSVGGFFEYSYDNLENFSLVSGARLDAHNRLGNFITPRVHVRYLPKENIIIRASLGSGRKAANIFAENQTLFGTNRVISIAQNGGDIYGLNPEKAWNYGVSIRKIFSLWGGNGDITADYYVTDFTDQVVVDWEEKGRISFYNLNGKSRANSFQLAIDYFPFKTLNFRFAYKNYDVKTTYNSGFLQRPLQAQHIFFGNVGWETERTIKGGQWRWDITFHAVGEQRLVNTIRDSGETYSPAYGLWNSQFTRALSQNFEIYAGVENLGNYTQKNPIIGVDDPFGISFDSAQVYAPIFGRMLYAGLRWNL
ncbi:MAG: outer membrane receptor for ferrienterochelin and colicins [Flavobacteriaceae bacterium]|jgi:outer membrane receptor for ferrienterochelin and colicins|tara:strand:+ start:172 stop:2400 length:2229 start_codon:yes stop_codon:yes gene_type:complete